MEVEIKPSSAKNKKWTAVFYKNGKKIKTSNFGAKGSKDYTIYYKEDGKKKANERKDLYYGRHFKREAEKWKSEPMSPAALSKYILWNKPTLKESINSYLKTFKLKLKK